MGLITKTEEFKPYYHDATLTTPTGLSALRFLGGIGLGIGMARCEISPEMAAASAVGLAITDAEGSLIKLAQKWPSKIRDGLRVWPTKNGAAADVVADKAFMISALAGGVAGGYVPIPALALIAPETATIATTLHTRQKLGTDPDVPTIGKIGMVARFAEMGAYLTAHALEDNTPALAENLQHVGYGLTATAFALGMASCYGIYKQAKGMDELQSAGMQLVQASMGQEHHSL